MRPDTVTVAAVITGGMALAGATVEGKIGPGGGVAVVKIVFGTFVLAIMANALNRADKRLGSGIVLVAMITSILVNGEAVFKRLGKLSDSEPEKITTPGIIQA